MKNIILRVLKITPAIVMVLLAGAALEAADPTGKTPAGDVDTATAMKAAAVSRYTPMEVYGVQVFIDQETGLMRTPTPEEAAALSAELKAQFGDIEAKTKVKVVPRFEKNGMISAQLDASHLNFSVVRLQPDGKLKFECGKDHDHTSDSVTTPIAAPETE